MTQPTSSKSTNIHQQRPSSSYIDRRQLTRDPVSITIERDKPFMICSVYGSATSAVVEILTATIVMTVIHGGGTGNSGNRPAILNLMLPKITT